MILCCVCKDYLLNCVNLGFLMTLLCLLSSVVCAFVLCVLSLPVFSAGLTESTASCSWFVVMGLNNLLTVSTYIVCCIFGFHFFLCFPLTLTSHSRWHLPRVWFSNNLWLQQPEISAERKFLFLFTVGKWFLIWVCCATGLLSTMLGSFYLIWSDYSDCTLWLNFKEKQNNLPERKSI